MKRTQVVREVADALHATEESLQATLASSRETLERLIAAREQLGLTGTVGDACVARMKEAIASMEEANEVMWESHVEAHTIMKTLNLRTIMSTWNTERPQGIAQGSKVA